jgi:hypothetical protein
MENDNTEQKSMIVTGKYKGKINTVHIRIKSKE